MANLNKIVYLSEEQKTQLFANNTITVNGTTVNYNDNDLYITPSVTDYAASSTVVTQASIDSNGLVSFKNSSGTAQFTLQLPLYSGGVS